MDELSALRMLRDDLGLPRAKRLQERRSLYTRNARSVYGAPPRPVSAAVADAALDAVVAQLGPRALDALSAAITRRRTQQQAVADKEASHDQPDQQDRRLPRGGDAGAAAPRAAG